MWRGLAICDMSTLSIMGAVVKTLHMSSGAERSSQTFYALLCSPISGSGALDINSWPPLLTITYYASIKLLESFGHLHFSVAGMACPQTLLPPPSPRPHTRTEAKLVDCRCTSGPPLLQSRPLSPYFFTGSLAQVFSQDGWDFHDRMADKRTSILCQL
jgi:hypothetical protein